VPYASQMPDGTRQLVTLQTGKQSRAALKASAKALQASLPGLKVAKESHDQGRKGPYDRYIGGNWNTDAGGGLDDGLFSDAA
jgi:hypothetical protein